MKNKHNRLRAYAAVTWLVGVVLCFAGGLTFNAPGVVGFLDVIIGSALYLLAEVADFKAGS